MSGHIRKPASSTSITERTDLPRRGRALFYAGIKTADQRRSLSVKTRVSSWRLESRPGKQVAGTHEACRAGTGKYTGDGGLRPVRASTRRLRPSACCRVAQRLTELLKQGPSTPAMPVSKSRVAAIRSTRHRGFLDNPCWSTHPGEFEPLHASTRFSPRQKAHECWPRSPRQARDPSKEDGPRQAERPSVTDFTQKFASKREVADPSHAQISETNSASRIRASSLFPDAEDPAKSPP